MTSQTIDRSDTGSSPLARGGPRRRCASHPPSWLIPARAGRTTPQGRPPHRRPAHPRSRGADGASSISQNDQPGSSPLARGGLSVSSRRTIALRLIPARAGRTCSRARVTAGPTAHPRSRGADKTARALIPLTIGSSPLARGGLAATDGDALVLRLIPARAGRTGSRRSRPTTARAHPRSRGADATAPPKVMSASGSSPWF